MNENTAKLTDFSRFCLREKNSLFYEEKGIEYVDFKTCFILFLYYF